MGGSKRGQVQVCRGQATGSRESYQGVKYYSCGGKGHISTRCPATNLYYELNSMESGFNKRVQWRVCWLAILVWTLGVARCW